MVVWSDLISCVDIMALRFLLIFPLTKQRRKIRKLEFYHWALCRPLKHHYHHLPLFKECAEGITSVMRPTWISTQYSLVGHPLAHALIVTCTHIHAHTDVLDFTKLFILVRHDSASGSLSYSGKKSLLKIFLWMLSRILAKNIILNFTT